MQQSNNSIFSKVFWITLLIKQNNYHRYGVLLHTLKVAYGAFKDKNYKFIIPALLHDIGKPFIAFQKEEDKVQNIYSFTGHEELSYEIVRDWSFLSKWSKDIIRYHFIITDMKRKKEKNQTEEYNKLESIWINLTPEIKEDLRTFLKYDNYGKN